MSTLALQLYYTSCKKGLSGYAGFQTRAESEGIDLTERREIEAKGLYQPPRDLPREPDAQTIAEKFPVALRSVTLSSGRTAIIRSCYRGQDYSGRWGNYFAHALVVQGELGGWPIDAYRWRGWVADLPPGEDERQPEALPAVSMEQAAAASSFSFPELRAFLADGEKRPELLASMIRAVFARAADSRSLVIRETEAAPGVQWMACIQKAFPAACHQSLTCCTYQFDPRTCQAINATIGETDFLFNDTERKYQFYVFDFVTGQHSEVAEAGAEYASAVAGWMASAPPRMQRFHEFAALFDQVGVGPDLIHVLRLWRLGQGEELRLAVADLLELVRFAGTRTRAGALASVLNVCEKLTGAMGESSSAADWAAVVLFLAGGARSTGAAEDFRRACEAWVKSFDAVVLGQQREEARIAALRGEVEATIGDTRAMAEAFLAEDHFNRVLANAGRLRGPILRTILAETVRSCRALYAEPEYATLPMRKLVLAVVRGGNDDVEWLLDSYREDREALKQLVPLVVRDIKGGGDNRHRAIGRSLAAVLAESKVRSALLRGMAHHEELSEILFGEWEASIERSGDRMQAQANYERSVLPSETCPEELRDRMASRLLELLGESARQQACEWVRSGQVACYSQEVARRVLSLAAEGIGLAPDDSESEKLAAAIEKELERRKIAMDLQRVVLRQAAVRAMADPPDTKWMKRRLQATDPRSYEEFAGLVLPFLLGRAKTVEDHRQAFLTMAVEAHAEAFRRRYALALEERPRDEFDDRDLAALGFWMNPNSQVADDPVFLAMRAQAVEALAERVAKLPRKTRGAVVSQAELRTKSGRKENREEWGAFLERIQGKRPGLLGWFFRR